MAAQTAATTIRESLGSLILFIFTFTSVADADTFASGLGTSVKGYWANSESAETAGDEGVNVTNSSGTFTLNIKTTGALTLYVLATV